MAVFTVVYPDGSFDVVRSASRLAREVYLDGLVREGCIVLAGRVLVR